MIGSTSLNAALRVLLVAAHDGDANPACDFPKKKVIRKPMKIRPSLAG